MAPAASPTTRVLGRYSDAAGQTRRLLARAAGHGSLLVVDAGPSAADVRVIAHLAADEPRENAELVCREYLAAPAAERGCRRLTAADLRRAPPSGQAGGSEGYAAERRDGAEPAAAEQELECGGWRYRLAPAPNGGSTPQLRWWRERGSRSAPVSLRELVAAMESYEPACGLTRSALGLRRGSGVSTTVLRSELRRVRESPIVLNRRLREAVLAALQQRGLSMSEIAMRCGRVKRDRQGNESGETSWLARRLGLLGDGAHLSPTPWIHSDVLATIARCGLGLSPREVET